jgi:sec-independent protein translocase protein TatA
MGEFSPIHWLIVLAIIVILFGGRRIPEVMRGMGEGIRSFKEGMRGGDTNSTPQNPAPPANTVQQKRNSRERPAPRKLDEAQAVRLSLGSRAASGLASVT